MSKKIAIGFFLLISFASSTPAIAGSGWLLDTIKYAWKTSTATEKADVAGEVADQTYSWTEAAIKGSNATDLYTSRRNNPSTVLSVGSIQRDGSGMTDALCSVVDNHSCYLAESVTKGQAAIGEYQNLSLRHDQAASTGKTMGERLQNLANSGSSHERDKAAILQEARKPIEDRSFGIFGDIYDGVRASGESMERALASLASLIDENTDFEVQVQRGPDGRPCGDMLWYMSLGERCQPENVPEPGEVGLRTEGRQCNPLPRDVKEFAAVMSQGGQMYGCPIAETTDVDRGILYTLGCPGKIVKVLVIRLYDSDTIRVSYLSPGESYQTDYEVCEMGTAELDQCSPSAIAERKRNNPDAPIYDCPL